MSSLRYILLLQRNVPQAARFYVEGLGFHAVAVSDKWAELKSGDSTIALKASDGEAFCTVGYSPVLVFNVHNLQESLTKMLGLGARMDGAIQYSVEGNKVASVRAPDGHMIGLVEQSEGS